MDGEMDRIARAAALVRATLSFGDASLRARYVANLVQMSPVAPLAQTLDAICERAEQAEASSREALIAIVDALNGEGMEPAIRRLRDEAARDCLLALERLIRVPGRSRASDVPPIRDPRSCPESSAKGRPVPLGERKSLARRPDRDTLQRLLRDPHPDVVRRCLGNPRLVEDDVVRLAAQRLAHAGALAEVGRSRWVHRPRVRLALVLNPATPPEVVARLTGLLLRSELRMAAQSPRVAAPVRALCFEHLGRRPPVEESDRLDPDLQ